MEEETEKIKPLVLVSPRVVMTPPPGRDILPAVRMPPIVTLHATVREEKTETEPWTWTEEKKAASPRVLRDWLRVVELVTVRLPPSATFDKVLRAPLAIRVEAKKTEPPIAKLPTVLR